MTVNFVLFFTFYIFTSIEKAFIIFMDSRVRQYLFGLIFFGFGVYEFTKNDPLEAAVYLTAGLAFITNNLISEPRLFPYKKILVTITWVLIILASLIFLYVLQFKFL